MNAYSMVAFIVLVSCCAWVMQAWITSRRGTGALMNNLRDSLGTDLDGFDDLMGDSRQAKSKIDALEKRIEVLERIVTDKKFDLNREFDKLRAS